MRPKIHDTHALSTGENAENPARMKVGTGLSSRMTAAEETFDRDRILDKARHPVPVSEETLLAEFV